MLTGDEHTNSNSVPNDEVEGEIGKNEIPNLHPSDEMNEHCASIASVGVTLFGVFMAQVTGLVNAALKAAEPMTQ